MTSSSNKPKFAVLGTGNSGQAFAAAQDCSFPSRGQALKGPEFDERQKSLLDAFLQPSGSRLGRSTNYLVLQEQPR